MAAKRTFAHLAIAENDSDQGAVRRFWDHEEMWKPILTAPFGRNLKLAVFDEDGEHALVFPCMKEREGWTNALTGTWVDIRPTHWRDWESHNMPALDGNPFGDHP